ncbi:MAG: ATP-grasp domain-containing protein [Planctomycetota bacterium]
MRARVLVSDAETPSALAVTRSLGRAGASVTVLARDRRAPAAASRFTRAAVIVPEPTRDPEGYTRGLLRTLARGGFDVFVPVTDTAMLLADRVRAELSRQTLLAMPERSVLETALEKTAVLDHASALGIPVLSRHEGERIPRAKLPAVVKPKRSRVLAGGVVRGGTASVVGDRPALAREADRLERLGLGAYAEPWVPGEGRGIFLLAWQGEILARFAHRRIREASPLGGPSAVCESVAAEPELLRRAEALARDLEIDGPLMVEFRGDVILEVNARYWGSLSLALDAGVDFPALHVEALLGRPAAGPDRWRIGVRRRNLAFDVRWAARVLRGRPAGLDVPWPGRARALADVFLERAGGIVHRRGDPSPARSHLVMLARKAVGLA